MAEDVEVSLDQRRTDQGCKTSLQGYVCGLLYPL